MSDIREAFEALNKYRKAYDEMYQVLGIFLDADEGLEKPDIDEAWAAFNLAPGPVYWKAIEAALSANGGACPSCSGSGTTEVLSDNSPDAYGVDVDCPDCSGTGANAEDDGWHGKPVCPGRYEVRGFDHFGTVGVVSVAVEGGELVCNLHDSSTAEIDEYSYYLSDIDEDFEWRTLYTHPTPPSVAVPEGFEFVYIHPFSKEKKTVVVTGEAVAERMSDYLEDALAEQICKCQPVGETNVVECGCEDYIEDFELQTPAAPSPDHSGDANKMAAPSVPESEAKARALEDFADDIDRRVAEWKAAKENALYRSIIEGQEWSGRARAKAARLRTAGGEEK